MMSSTSESPPVPPVVSPRGGGRRSGRGRRLARLALKELRETLRDRRTIGTLLLMPVLVYPLLSLAFNKFLVTQLRPVTGSSYHIAVESEQAIQILHRLLRHGHALVNAERQPAGPSTSTETPPAGPAVRPAISEDVIDYEVYPDIARAMAELNADVGVRLVWHGSRFMVDDLPLESAWEVLVVEGSPRSEAAFTFIDRRLKAASIDLLRARLERTGRPARLPVQSRWTAISAHGGGSPFSLATLVPLILILMTMTGAVYPAIDLTAGERERGTLEALVAAPVPRMGLLVAKYVAVLTVALLTAGVNLAAMTATVAASGLGTVLFGDEGLSLGVVALILGLLVLLAAFFSAVLLALTSFARSFKEAQAYLIPLMLVSLAPGMLSLVPGLELNGALAIVPLANIVLLARDLFDRTADPAMATVVVVSTAVYALAAIAAAARVFGTDAILYGSEGSWSDVFRRPRVPRRVPTLAAAMLCLALLFPLSVLTAGVLALQQGLAVPVRLVTASLATAALFGLLPLAVTALRRIDPRTGFALRGAPPLAWLGAALLGLSLWPLAYEATLLMNQLARLAKLELLDTRLIEQARALIGEFRTLSPAVVVLCLAVVPAAFEELFFRGFLFGALAERFRPAAAVVTSAVLFGLFHVVVRDSLAVERLLPSTLLGLVLGWLRLRSGSVLPGVLLHGCHNALLLMLVFYEERLAQADFLNLGGWLSAEAGTGHLPMAVLLAGCGIALAGAALTWLSREPEPTPPEQE